MAWRGGEWLLRYMLYENTAFAIYHVDVQTDGVLSLEQIRRWAGVKLEENLLALDLTRVKRDLEWMSVIRSASVERVLPHTLRIRVMEREPVAKVSFPQPVSAGVYTQAVYTIDLDGVVMFPLDPSMAAVPSAVTNLNVPALVGIPPNQLRPGRRLESPQTRAGLHLLAGFAHSAMNGLVEIKEIDVSNPGVLNIVTGQNCEVTFGLQNIEAQLQRWRAVYDLGQRLGKNLAWMDLSVSNNVPARWLEAAVVPAPPAKPAQPLRQRRKNV